MEKQKSLPNCAKKGFKEEIQEADLSQNETYRRFDLELKSAILEQLKIMNETIEGIRYPHHTGPG